MVQVRVQIARKKERGDSDDNVQTLHCGLSARYLRIWILLGCVISTWINGSLRSISSLGTSLLNLQENYPEVCVLRHVWGDNG